MNEPKEIKHEQQPYDLSKIGSLCIDKDKAMNIMSNTLNVKTYPKYIVYDGILYERKTYEEVVIINTKTGC